MKRLLLSTIIVLILCAPALAVEPINLAWHSGVAGAGVAASCPSYGSELNTAQNASAPTGITEEGDTDGWTNGGCSTFDHNGTAYSGSYAVQGVADSNGDYFKYVKTFEADKVYKLSFQVRHTGSGGLWQCNGPANMCVFPSITNAATSYSEKTCYFMAPAESHDLVYCAENNATNDGGLYVDSVSYKEASLCYGSDLHTSAVASSLTNEANAVHDGTNGWTAKGAGVLVTSDATAADGSYAIKIETNTTPTDGSGANIDLGSTPFSLGTGTKYLVDFKARHVGSGSTWMCGFASSSSGTASTTLPNKYFASATEGSYEHWGMSITYSSSYRYFVCHEASGANTGGVYIDSFRVRQITGE